MSRKQTILLALTAATIVIGLVAVVHDPKQAARIPAQTGGPGGVTPSAAIQPAPTSSPPIQSNPPVHPTMVAERANASVVPARPARPIRNNGGPAQAKPPLQDPEARLALSFVGVDPMAEQYWMAAINDPDLPAEERKDLIEDLNEDGLSDPKHPGPEDLPLIVSRLRLIETLAPEAMDPVNAGAFAEAYRDLSNLLAGQPAQ